MSAEKAERRRGLEPPYVRPGGTPASPFMPPASAKEKEPAAVEKEGKLTPKRIETPEKKEEPEQKKPKRLRTD